MNKVWMLAAAMLVLGACSPSEEKSEGKEQVEQAMQQEAPAKRDVSNETLVSIDPDIQTYIDRLEAAQAAVKENDNATTQIAVIEAYLAFGDYMTYESTVSPREGKYHRALIEYRHALELDPDSEKAKIEIAQIEDIYHSMNRPVPGEE